MINCSKYKLTKKKYNNTCLEHCTGGDVMQDTSVKHCHLKVKCSNSDVFRSFK